jgi:predicted esterase
VSRLDGPRLKPANGRAATSLVVLLHGYGADGNDLIDLARAWAPVMPGTAFISPHRAAGNGFRSRSPICISSGRACSERRPG